MEINWKELAEKYQMEAEIYMQAYEDVLRPIRIVSAMQGALVQMESERLKFEAKKGQSAKSKETGERINVLIEGLDQLSGIAERNIAMKYQLAHKSRKVIALYQEIDRLKKELSWDDSKTH